MLQQATTLGRRGPHTAQGGVAGRIAPALTTCDGAVRRGALWRPGARPARPLDASEGAGGWGGEQPAQAAGLFLTVPTYSSPDVAGGAAREAERY